MAHALETAEASAILQSHADLSFRNGRYSYRIQRNGASSIYNVSDGTRTITAPLLWVFGRGAAGQTYVYQYGDAFYESRVSFYNAVNGLDLTMGAANEQPPTLEEAAGRKMSRGDVGDCFNCHATGVSKQAAAPLASMTPGVQCERCHGSAEQHVQSLKPMPKLSALTTEEVSNLCGGCHRTWDQIAASGPHNILNVRFQPYRLTNSKCYDSADRRIACTACHDPHGQTLKRAAFYDTKCQACHAGQSAKARPCRTAASSNCVFCHMPKLELAGAHYSFTDHMIRIVKAGAPYPQ